jgi:hypothetical protein
MCRVKEEYNFCNKTVAVGQPETMEYRENHQGETEAGIEDHVAADVVGVYKNIFLLRDCFTRWIWLLMACMVRSRQNTKYFSSPDTAWAGGCAWSDFT